MRRRILSTHVLRRQARRSKRHYEQLIARALIGGPGSGAAIALAQLDINLETTIKVERARNERAKWVVVGVND